MRFQDHVPRPIWRAARALIHLATRDSRLSPAQVVKANTQEAFEFFWSQNDFIAEQYLDAGRLAFYEIVAEHCAHMLTNSGLGGRVRAADIGCGAGHMLHALTRRLGPEYETELFGLDFATAAIAKAHTLLPTATLVVGDIYSNILPSDFFDLVLSIEVLEHLRWPEDAIQQLFRVCKPGGNIIITVPNAATDNWDGHVNFWSVEELGDLLRSHGLVDMKLIQGGTKIMAWMAK